MNGTDPVIGKIYDKLDEISKGISSIDRRLIKMETWQGGHENTHEVIEKRLNSHADDIKKSKSIIDTWKGYAFVISVAMSVGTIVGVIIKYL